MRPLNGNDLHLVPQKLWVAISQTAQSTISIFTFLKPQFGTLTFGTVSSLSIYSLWGYFPTNQLAVSIVTALRGFSGFLWVCQIPSNKT